MDIRQIRAAEQVKLLPLLGKCFPVWAKYENAAVFPVEMTSFAAEEKGIFAAHCGVVEFTVSDGFGGKIPLGGLASVCTDPDFRHRGLAEDLCRAALEYAKSKKLAGVPLFTSFERVYAKNNWWNYPIFTPKLAKWKIPGAPQEMKKGTALSPEEKEKIIALYETGFDFPGKVFRSRGASKSIFSWQHHFGKFEFSVGENHYASGGGNVVCELNGDRESAEEFLLTLPRENDATIFILPENSPFWSVIAALAEVEESDIFFHGPMVIDTDARALFRSRSDIYFPLADRF